MEQNIQLKKKWGARKIVSLVLFVIIFASLAYFGWTQYVRWYEERRIYIESGLASDKFPFRMYTNEELKVRGLWPPEGEQF
jgi:hypothetical protein